MRRSGACSWPVRIPPGRLLRAERLQASDRHRLARGRKGGDLAADVGYIAAITASPNWLHFTSFAPSIWRAKS